MEVVELVSSFISIKTLVFFKKRNDVSFLFVTRKNMKGKSTLVIMFVQGVFVEVHDPTIEDSYLLSLSFNLKIDKKFKKMKRYRKVLKIDETNYILDILDTAGFAYLF